MFHFWFPGQHYIRLQTAGSTALNHSKLAKADAQNSRWLKASAGLGRAAGDPAQPAGPLGGAGWAEPPFPRALEQVHPRICNALTVRKPASSESLAAQTREGLQGNREYINSSWKHQELHAEDCSHHVPHGWKTTERPRPIPTALLFAANKCGHKQRRCCQIQKKSIPSATSCIPSPWKTPYLCNSKGHALHHLICKIKVKSFMFRNK